jgi:hypothetical protein
LSLRSPFRPRNRGKKTVPTGTPAPTLLGSRSLPSSPRGEPPLQGPGESPLLGGDPSQAEASHAPSSCPCACLFSLEGEARKPPQRENHSDGPTHQRHAAIKVVPDPANESGTRSPGRLPAPSRPGPGLRLKGPRLAPALSALALPGGKITAPQLWDGPKEHRGKPPLHLPASARMGRAVRGKRSTTPSPRGESLPRPTSRGALRTPLLPLCLSPKVIPSCAPS